MTWDPRDLDTWIELDSEDARAAEEAASEQRLAAERATVVAQMRGGR